MYTKFFGPTVLMIISLTHHNIAASQNVVAERAKISGISKCLPTIIAVSDFIIKREDHGANSTWSKERPNSQVFNSIVEVNTGNEVEVTDITVAPVTGGDCAGLYTKITYFPKSCFSLGKEVFDNWEYKGNINKQVTQLKSDRQVDAYLMPAGSGCIFIKKEILFNGANPSLK